MKKSARILVSLMSLLVFMLCLSGFAAADEVTDPSVTVKCAPNLQNGININLQETSGVSSSLIKQWNCTIINNSNGNIVISSETMTYNAVNNLTAQVYLQRWNGSNWVDVTSRTYSNSSNTYVSGSDQLSVTRGYSYRCRAIHTAQTGSNSETKTSVSNVLFIQ